MKNLALTLLTTVFLGLTAIGQSNEKTLTLTQKQQDRYISPEAWFIGVHYGGTAAVNKIIDPLNILEQGSMLGNSFGLSVEKGYKKNIFFTSRASVYENWGVDKFETMLGGGMASNAYWSGQIGVGVGYRLIGPKNYNYLNIALNWENAFSLNGKNGWGGSYYSTDFQNSPTQRIQSYQTFERVVNIWTSAISLRLSKDFRLTNFLYLGLDYQYQLGLRKTYQRDISYVTFTPQVVRAESYMDGTAHQVLVGLKVKL